MSNKGSSVNMNAMNNGNNHFNNHNHMNNNHNNNNHNMKFDKMPANTQSQIINGVSNNTNGGFLNSQLNGMGLSNSLVYANGNCNTGKEKLNFLVKKLFSLIFPRTNLAFWEQKKISLRNG
jgi:hypothetical protein